MFNIKVKKSVKNTTSTYTMDLFEKNLPSGRKMTFFHIPVRVSNNARSWGGEKTTSQR